MTHADAEPTRAAGLHGTEPSSPVRSASGDDGSVARLSGMRLPDLSLTASDGSTVALTGFRGRTVLYCYPLTTQPGVDAPAGWDEIPGARGCTPEACGFRDHFRELQRAGVAAVWGVSSQNPAYQAEVAARLHLPFRMLSDASFELADALGLPTFAATGHPRLHTRLTLVLADDRVEHAFFPVMNPASHAEHVLDWVAAHPA